MLGTIVIILLILFLVGALPTWPHSQSWGYAPTGILGTILIIVLILYPPWAAIRGGGSRPGGAPVRDESGWRG